MIKSLIRLAWLVVLLLGTLASLLTFPSGMPVMIALWCFWFTILTRRPRLAWFPVLQLAVILVIKQPPLGFGTAMLSFALIICLWQVMAVNVRARKLAPELRKVFQQRRLLLAAACFWAGTIAVFWQWDQTTHTSRQPTLDPARPIAVIGDSISSGTVEKYAYAPRLGKLLDVEVLDFSRPGITSAEALKKDFPKLLAARPQCVVIEIGGHDYLDDDPRSVPEANIRTMIEQARAIDCEVILMEVPRDFILSPYCGLERDLAAEYDLELIPDTPIRRMVLWSPLTPPGFLLDPATHLSDDALHPNEQGAQMLAEYVAAALARVYGAEVLAQ